jgi:hypothetical protein
MALTSTQRARIPAGPGLLAGTTDDGRATGQCRNFADDDVAPRHALPKVGLLRKMTDSFSLAWALPHPRAGIEQLVADALGRDVKA